MTKMKTWEYSNQNSEFSQSELNLGLAVFQDLGLIFYQPRTQAQKIGTLQCFYIDQSVAKPLG